MSALVKVNSPTEISSYDLWACCYGEVYLSKYPLLSLPLSLMKPTLMYVF